MQISKELFKAVMNCELKEIKPVRDIKVLNTTISGIMVTHSVDDWGETNTFYTNFYEAFASKGKNWANEKNYFIESRYIKDFKCYRSILYYDNGSTENMVDFFTGSSEVETILNALQYVYYKIDKEEN